MRIALAGQPNCGKSTIFNALAGYKAITANFPGKTVRYTLSSVTFGGKTFEILIIAIMGLEPGGTGLWGLTIILDH